MENTEIKINGVTKVNTELVQHSFSNETLELIKNTVAPKSLTDTEFEMFIYQAKRTGLDPLSRQIYCIKNKDKVSIQATIDGFRLIAERTGEYSGQTPVMWCGENGEWKDVWLNKTPPAAAKVGVLRKGFTEPLFAVAKFDTYAQKNFEGKINYTWSKMPDLMIGKCAEALALRKAFPQELSNIYSSEEMANFEDQPEEKPVKKIIPTEKTESETKLSFVDRAINYFGTLATKELLEKAYNDSKERNDYKELSFQDQIKFDDEYLKIMNTKFPKEETVKSESPTDAIFNEVPFADDKWIMQMQSYTDKKELDTFYLKFSTAKEYKQYAEEYRTAIESTYAECLNKFKKVKK